MNSYQELSLDEASRHAVTAAVADLADWSRTVAVSGLVELDDLLGVLEILRAASEPQLQSSPTLELSAAHRTTWARPATCPCSGSASSPSGTTRSTDHPGDSSQRGGPPRPEWT
jgi:hypothetical protein